MEEEPQPVVTVPDASQLTFQQFTDEVFRQWMEEDTIDRHYTVRNPNNFGIQQEEAVLRSETEEAKINYYKQLHQIKVGFIISDNRMVCYTDRLNWKGQTDALQFLQRSENYV